METVKRDGIWVEKAQTLFQIQQRRKLIEEEEAKIAEELRALSDGRSSLGGGFKYDIIVRSGAIDYKAIPALKGVNLDYYRKPNVQTWKLSFVGEVYTDGK